jgi:hypothetical protein
MTNTPMNEAGNMTVIDWQALVSVLYGQLGLTVRRYWLERDTTGTGFHVRASIETRVSRMTWESVETVQQPLQEAVGAQLTVRRITNFQRRPSSELFFVFEHGYRLHRSTGTPVDDEGRPYCTIVGRRDAMTMVIKTMVNKMHDGISYLKRTFAR